VEEDFAIAQKYVDLNYEKCRPIHEDTFKWDEEAFANEPHDDLDLLKAEITKLRGWGGAIQQQIKDTSKGIVNVDGKKIKGRLTPHVQSRLEFYKEFMYGIMKNKADELQSNLKKFTSALDKQPTELGQYAKLIETQQEAARKKEEMINSKNDIDMLVTQLKKFEGNIIKNTDDAQQTYIQQDYSRLEQDLITASKYIGDKKEEMAEKLAKSVEDLRADVKQTAQLVNSGVLVLEELGPVVKSIDEATRELPAVKSQLNDIRKAIDKYKARDRDTTNYAKLMGLRPEVNRDLNELEACFSDRRLLWNNLEKYSKNIGEWFNGNFLSQNTEEIETEMKQFENSNVLLRSRIANLSDSGKDKILELFMIEIKQLTATMPVYTALGNKDMKPRHWKRIFESLSPDYQPSKSFSFVELQEKGIMDKKDLVEEVSGRATGEA